MTACSHESISHAETPTGEHLGMFCFDCKQMVTVADLSWLKKDCLPKQGGNDQKTTAAPASRDNGGSRQEGSTMGANERQDDEACQCGEFGRSLLVYLLKAVNEPKTGEEALRCLGRLEQEIARAISSRAKEPGKCGCRPCHRYGDIIDPPADMASCPCDCHETEAGERKCECDPKWTRQCYERGCEECFDCGKPLKPSGYYTKAEVDSLLAERMEALLDHEEEVAGSIEDLAQRRHLERRIAGLRSRFLP